MNAKEIKQAIKKLEDNPDPLRVGSEKQMLFMLRNQLKELEDAKKEKERMAGMVVHFVSGKTKEVNQKAGEYLLAALTQSSGCAKWQIFSSKKDKPDLFINLDHVEYIDKPQA